MRYTDRTALELSTRYGNGERLTLEDTRRLFGMGAGGAEPAGKVISGRYEGADGRRYGWRAERVEWGQPGRLYYWSRSVVGPASAPGQQ